MGKTRSSPIPFGLLCLSLSATAQITSKEVQQEAVKPPEKATTVAVVGNIEDYDPRREDTAAKIVVGQAEIAKYGDTLISDVLKRQSGITVSTKGRGATEIRMRGLGAGYTQILLNGQPLPAGFSLDSLSPSLVEKIEIMRAATAEYSTKSIAGTINIVLKSKMATSQNTATLGLEYANQTVAESGSFLFSDRNGKLSYLVAGSLRNAHVDVDSTEDQYGTTESGVAYSRHADHNISGSSPSLSLAPRLVWVMDNKEMLVSQSVITAVYTNARGRNNWTTSYGTPSPYASEPDRVTLDNATLRSDLSWSHKLDGGGKLDSRINVNANGVKTDVHQEGIDPKGLTLVDRIAQAGGRELGAGTNGKYSVPLIDTHTFATGWDAGWSFSRFYNLQNDRPVSAVAPENWDDHFRAAVLRTALFAQDEWRVRSNWSMYLGVRWERIRTTSAGENYARITNTSSVWSPLAQTLWKFPNSKSDQLRFALTRTYKAQPLARLIPRGTYSIHNSAISPDVQGNPHLQSELATGLDGGYEHFIGSEGVLSASVFYRKISNYTLSDLVFVDERWVLMPVNAGTARTRGVELEAKFPLKKLFGEQAAHFDARANLARNWSSIDNLPNSRLADQSPLSANLGLDYKPGGAFTMGGNLGLKRGGTVRTSPRQTSYQLFRRDLEMYALYKWDAKTQLRITGINLLRAPNYTSVTYEGINGVQTDTIRYAYKAGIRATLELKL